MIRVMTKPHMDDYTSFHQTSHTDSCESCWQAYPFLMIFWDISGYFIHQNHGVIARYSILCAFICKVGYFDA